jgi:hypothetical protein
MDGGRHFDRRTLLALAGGLVAVPAVASCGRAPSAPTISDSEVQKLQDDYARTVFRAMRTRNRTLLKTVESGELLERDLDSMRLATKLKTSKTSTDEFTYPHSTGYPVTSSSSNDQQQLLTVGDYSNTTKPWRNLGLYVRNGPAAPWLRTFSGGLYADDIPDFAKGQPVQPLAPDSTGYAAAPNTVPSLVAKALQKPDSSEGKLFGASDVRQRFADDLAAAAEEASEMGTVSREYSPGTFLLALATDGGYLVLGTYTFTQTVASSSGKKVYFAKTAPEHKVYPDKYHRAVSDWGGMFAATVPQAGKLMLISGEERQTGLEVS